MTHLSKRFSDFFTRPIVVKSGKVNLPTGKVITSPTAVRLAAHGIPREANAAGKPLTSLISSYGNIPTSAIEAITYKIVTIPSVQRTARGISMGFFASDARQQT